MLDRFIQESPLYQEILEKGEQIGLQKGALLNWRGSIAEILGYRFPTLKEAGNAQLATMNDVALLRQLVVQVAIAPDESAARALLGLPV